jgi:hypothetical protein
MKEAEVLGQGLPRKDRRQLMQEGLGFRRVFKLLTAAKKPLIGHNILSDLANLYSSFKGGLPLDFGDFRALVHADFPVVYDTSYMYNHIPRLRLKSWPVTSLPVIRQHLKPSTEFSVPLHPSCPVYEGRKAYEEGYDGLLVAELYLIMRALALM